MIGLITAGFLIVQFARELPDASQIQGLELKVPLRVYSAEKLLISEFGDERRKPLAYADIPQTLIDAVLASEDDGFFNHGGIDLKGLVRAALSNFQSGSSGQGASTITMQVARNFFLTRDKTYTRKIKEILLALRLEQQLTKEEILGLYINKIFLGHRAYGFGAAAEVYYAKPISELTLAQTAMLAGLPKAPSTFNPLRNASRAIIRRNYVLGRLLELELISNEAHDQAISEPVSAEKHVRQTGLNAPHIAEMVRAQLTEQFGEEAYWQGLNVYTTIQAEPQRVAAKALRSGLKEYDQRHGFRGAVGNIDLKALTASENGFDEAYENALSVYPYSQEQVPAIVTLVDANTATIWMRDYGQSTISLESSMWARRHKTADLRGDPIKSMTEVLAQGNVIYVEPMAHEATNTSEGAENVAPKSTKWQLSQIPAVSGALISIAPNSGEIISLVGGYDFFLNKYNRAVQSIRQPGSNIKPFIYSAALDHGFTPASLISGAPIVITDPAHGTVWRPENYSGQFYGPTRMREALAKSMNLVSIRLLRAIGVDYARDYVARFGIDMQRFSRTLTMALGSGGATPLEVLSAYSTLANGGYRVNPYFIQSITDRNGEVLYQAPQAELCDTCFSKYIEMPPLLEPIRAEVGFNEGSQAAGEDIAPDAPANNRSSILEAEPQTSYLAPRVMSHANNFLTVSMMKEVIQNGTARRAKSLNRTDLAGKTGTTNDYVDAWFSGFNSQVATTVWVGFDDPTSMGKGESGSKAALPIWVNYMQSALKGIPQDTDVVPEYIEAGYVDRATGQRTMEEDPDAIPEYFVVKPLTPEYALYRTLLREHLEDGTLSAEQFIEQLRLEGAQPSESALQSLGNLGVDGEMDPDELDEEEPSLDPEERIIETEEETEGLF